LFVKSLYSALGVLEAAFGGEHETGDHV
jgi:hypothetical protein